MNNIEILEKLKVTLTIHHLGGAEAIENLIQENKQLKDTNKKLYELCQGNAMQEFINNECDYIHKSKVKKKIEEYNDILDYAETEEGMAELKDYEYDEAKYGRKVLKELLEGE